MDNNLSLHDRLVQLKSLEEFNQSVKSSNEDLISYIHMIEEQVYATKTNKAGIITDVSNSFCKLSGFSREDLIGKTHAVIKSPDSSKIFFKKMWQTIANGDVWEGDIKNINKDGSILWLRLVIFPRYDNNKKIVGYSSIRHNITTVKKLKDEAIHDALTGLYNRRYYDIAIIKELKRAQRGKIHFTFVMMDIDYFKQYNDTYGHQKGDKALKKIADLLTKKLNRGSDYCFRLGGEEFGFFFTGQTTKESFEYTKSVCLEIEKLHILHEKNKISKYLTASFGLVTVDMQLALYNEEFIYGASDIALYKAKEAGRNQVIVYDQE